MEEWSKAQPPAQIRRRGDVSAGFSRRTAEPLPQSLYQCRDVDLLYGVFTIDAEAVAPFVPPELRIAGSNLGCYGIYTVGSSLGLATYSHGFCAVVLEGHDSPDGSEGAYILHAYASGRARDVIAEMFDASVIYGEARVWKQDGLYHGTAGIDGEPMFSVSARPVGEQMQKIDGIDVYVGRRRSGELVSFDIPMSGPMLVVETVDFQIADDAPEPLKAMQPVKHLYAQYLSGLSFGWGLPRSISPARRDIPHNATRAFLDLFGRGDRAAIVLRRNGETVHINPRARALVGPDVARRGGVLIGLRASEQAALDAAIADVLGRTEPYVSRPILLSRLDAAPVIAQVTSVDPAVAGSDAVLMFLVDPSLAEGGDPTPALQLLGLTPAEARVAALVGEGQPPREAAETLGLTENTVRAALRIIYGKLGIGRQSELAKLVARLERSVGSPP